MQARIVALLLAVAFGGLAAAQRNVVPVEIARTDGYSEGPVFDDDGNLYVSHERFISRMSPDGDVKVWAGMRAPKGHKILADGTHLICDDELLHLDAAGNFLGTAATHCGSQPIRRTNDLTLDSLGGVYFTDPGVPAEGALEDEKGKLCYLDASGSTHLVADNLGFPNGVILTPDEKTLLVGESMPGRNRVLKFPVISPGDVGEAEVFATLPPAPDERFVSPDGMAFDRAGRLYVAHYGMGQVHVYRLDGTLLRSLPAGMAAVSNLAFGGPEMNQLYVTGSEDFFEPTLPGFVYRLDLDNVRGLPVRPPAKREIAEFPYTRLYADADGSVRFGEETLRWDGGDEVAGATEIYERLSLIATELRFVHTPPGFESEWHAPSRRQYVLVVSGTLELETRAGDKRRFQAGQLLLVEDTSGEGHVTRSVGDEDLVMALVTVPLEN